MAIPTGYEKLAAIGIAYKGDYTDGTAYKLLSAVYYNGATYVALKDDPVTPPVADGANWQYLAKGFTDGVLSAIEATDTSGLIGEAGATVGAQALLDVIADKVAIKLLAKNQVVNNLLATEPGNVLDACQGKALKDLLDQQNSDMEKCIGYPDYSTGQALTINTDNTIPQNGYIIGRFGGIQGNNYLITINGKEVVRTLSQASNFSAPYTLPVRVNDIVRVNGYDSNYATVIFYPLTQ